MTVPNVEPDEYVQYRAPISSTRGVIEEYEFHVPYAEDPSAVLMYYTRGVATEDAIRALSITEREQTIEEGRTAGIGDPAVSQHSTSTSKWLSGAWDRSRRGASSAAEPSSVDGAIAHQLISNLAFAGRAAEAAR
jgi:hypothetical protein